MKMRNKGKVHPFTSSSSSPSSSAKDGGFPVLKLLPAAILALVSVLSLEDREVLAYMITRSLKTANPSSFPVEDKRKSSKKLSIDGNGHKPPALFDCECFHCYTSYWFKWDSSPNRELIHQAIEAFEEHLSNGEQSKKGGSGKNKRKEKMGRRKNERTTVGDTGGGLGSPVGGPPENQVSIVTVLPEIEVTAAEVEELGVEDLVPVNVSAEAEDDVAAAPPCSAAVQTHKGLARKVLPDVIGILNSRLWSLWGPNV